MEWNISHDINETTLSHKYTEFTCGTSTYDTRTVVSFTKDQAIASDSQIQAIVAKDVACVVLEKTCFIFDENMKNCGNIVNLESSITCLAICPEGDFILIGSSDSKITVIYRPQNKCVFTRALTRKDDEEIESAVINRALFTPVDPITGICEIMITTNGGNVFHLANINLPMIRSELSKDNGENLLNVLSSIVQSEISLACNDINCSFVNSRNMFIVSGEGVKLVGKEIGSNFQVLKSIAQDSFPGKSIVRSAICCNYRYVVALDNLKVLHLICLKTFIIIEIWDEIQVEDFILIENLKTLSNQKVDSTIFMKTSVDGKFTLQLCSLPKFEVIVSIPVSPSTRLFDVSINLESLLFLDIGSSDVSDKTTVVVYATCEASPNSRLLHLIGKRQFDEAVTFAETFNLDVELVYKSKAAVLFEEIGNIDNTQTICRAQDLKTSLFECLDQILDFNLVITYCMNSSMPNLSAMREVLLYAKSKVTSNFEFDAGLLTELFDMLRKLESFNLLHEDQKWSTFRVMWDRFKNARLWDELLLYLSCGKLAKVSLIWARHCEELVLDINDGHILNLLESIPGSPITSAWNEWLKMSLLPFILIKVKNSIKTVASWIYYKCLTMEFIDYNNWPGNAIAFAHMFVDVCKEISSNVLFENLNLSIDLAVLLAEENNDISNSILRKIRVLLDDLEDMDQLKRQFNCKMSLASYSQNDKRQVVFNLFEWIYLPEDIPTFISEFLSMFARNNLLNIDSVLEDYIQDVLDQTEFDWKYGDEAPWEKHVIAIINCFKSEDHRLRALCQMLKVAPVPWTSILQELVEESLKSSHSLVEFIKHEKSCEMRRVIMRKYGFYCNDNLDFQMGNILICHILTSSKDSSAIDDALVIADAIRKDPVELYLFRFRHLIKTEQMQEFYLWLESIPVNIATRCCQRLALFTVDLITDSCDHEELLVEFLNFTNAAIYGLQYLKKHTGPFEFDEYSDVLDQLSKSQALQEFGVVMPLKVINSASSSVLALNDCIENFLISEELVFKYCPKIPNSFESERKIRNCKCSMRDLFRVANLFNISKHNAAEMIVNQAIKLKKIHIAVEACTHLCNYDFIQESAYVLSRLIYRLLENICLETNLLNLSVLQQVLGKLNTLLANASVKCNSDELNSVTSVLRWMYLIQHIINMPSFGIGMSECLTQDSFNCWNFSSMFQESAVYLDYGKVLRLIGVAIQQYPKVSANFIMEDIEDLLSSFKDLIEYLSARGRILLSFYVNTFLLTECCATTIPDTQQTSVIATLTKRASSLAILILKNLFNHKKLDTTLALGMIMSLPKRAAISFLLQTEKKCGYDYGRIAFVAALGIEMHCRWCAFDEISYYQSLATEAQWGKKLARFQISYKDFFRKPASEKLKLISTLAIHRKVNITLIQEFLAVFGLASDSVYQNILQLLLTSSNEKESPNKRSLTETLKLCTAIIKEMPEKFILTTLTDIFAMMDPYNYEAIEFILKSISQVTDPSIHRDYNERITKNLKLLEFLISYERKSRPLELEFNLWLENNSEVYNKEKTACFKRLPFHHLLDPSKAIKIIAGELVPETVSSWLAMSNILLINKNDMIMLAIENIVKHIIPNSETSKLIASQTLWTENSNTMHIFVSVHNFLKCIDNLEKATVCMISIIKRLPQGLSKIIAIKSAIDFTEKWWESSKVEKAASTLKILKKMSRNISIDRLFQELRLNVDYSSLKENPEELINRILEHESIETRYWFNTTRHPDLFGACERLAELYNLDFEKLCLSLLYKWLVPAEYALDGILDESITEDLNFSRLNGTFSETSTSQKDHQMRAIYVFRQLKSDDSIAYLVSLLQSNSASFSQGDRLRYLSCLLHTKDIDALHLLMGQSIDELRNTAKKYYCGMQLESINLSCLMEELSEDSVIANLIAHLIHNYGQNSIAVIFAADLCLDNNNYTAAIWNSILMHMMALKLIKPLTRVLCALSSHPEIITTSVYRQAWKVVLTASDEDEKSLGIGRLILIQKCPALEELDLIALADVYKEASLPLLAIECYLHLPNHTDGHTHIQELIASTENVLLKAIEAIEQVGDLYHLREILYAIILALTSTGKLQKIWNGPHKDWLKKNVLSQEHFKDIILYSAVKQRWSECKDLIRLIDDEVEDTRVDIKGTTSLTDAKSFVKKYAELHQMELLVDLASS